MSEQRSGKRDTAVPGPVAYYVMAALFVCVAVLMATSGGDPLRITIASVGQLGVAVYLVWKGARIHRQRTTSGG